MEYEIIDKYEGLDPEITDLLKQEKYVKGKFWDNGEDIIDYITEGYLTDYISQMDGDFKYKCSSDGEYYQNFKPTEKQKIDWTKVKVDTLLRVWDFEDVKVLRYFKEFKYGIIVCFMDGKTSKTISDKSHTDPWNYAEIVEEPKW